MQIICMLAGGFFFLWFALPFLAKGILNIGNLTGMAVFFLMFCFGMFQNRIHVFLMRMKESKGGSVFLYGCGIVLVLLVVVVCMETIAMIRAAGNKPPANTTAVVLGCSVKGTQPSAILQERLDAAYDYLCENEQAKCILSGGQGPGEDITEAECMYRVLVKKGIAEERLIKEERSTDTEENLRYTKELLAENNLKNEITIVTSEFHAYRACAQAKKLGFESYSTPSSTFFLYLPTFYVRELYGVLYYMVMK